MIEDTTGITFKILVERFGIPIPDIIQVELPPSPVRGSGSTASRATQETT